MPKKDHTNVNLVVTKSIRIGDLDAGAEVTAGVFNISSENKKFKFFFNGTAGGGGVNLFFLGFVKIFWEICARRNFSLGVVLSKILDRDTRLQSRSNSDVHVER